MLETRRLLLRPLVPADLDGLYALYGQPVLMHYITGRRRSYEQTAERLRRHLVDWEQYGFGLCAAVWKETGQMIGRCGLEPVEEQVGLAGDMAWMFAQAFWGQGLATEFARAMIPYAFKQYNLMRIFATADHRNKASIRVMEKSGLRFCRATERGVEYEIYPSDLSS